MTAKPGEFDLLARLAANLSGRRDEPALIFDGDIVTYGRLDDVSSALAARFAARGLAAGDRVLVAEPPSPLLYCSILALVKLGAAVVFIDHTMSLREMEGACRLAAPRALVAGLRGLPLLLSSAVRSVPLKFFLRQPAAGSRGPSLRPDAYAPDSLMFIRFTSGTTGRPKGVARPYGHVCALFSAAAAFSRSVPGAIDLTSYPMNTLYNLCSGAATVCPRPGAAPRELARLFSSGAAATASLTPAALASLAGYCEARDIKLPALRFLFTGGEPVPPELLRRLRAVFTSAEIAVVYGSTEAYPIAWTGAAEAEKMAALAPPCPGAFWAGRPHPALRLRVLRPGPGLPEDAPPGEPGELAVSGPQVVRSYFGDADGSLAARFKFAGPDGALWYRTGDLGVLRDGGVWLAGRARERSA